MKVVKNCKLQVIGAAGEKCSRPLYPYPQWKKVGKTFINRKVLFVARVALGGGKSFSDFFRVFVDARVDLKLPVPIPLFLSYHFIDIRSYRATRDTTRSSSDDFCFPRFLGRGFNSYSRHGPPTRADNPVDTGGTCKN